MCGIVGYIGHREATPVLLDGLKRLEYRGYDSAGVAVMNGTGVQLRRCEGKLSNLEAALKKSPINGNLGLGHTRWATHGRPCETNAHPHMAGGVVVVHNGIIENYEELRRFLEERRHHFASETDSEVLSHLIEDYANQGIDLKNAVRKALGKVEGSYAIGVFSEKDPTRLIAARRASPLVIGLGHGENLIASDVPALLNQTRDVVFMEDGEIAEIIPGKVSIETLRGEKRERSPQKITWTAAMAEKAGYPHFMLKEICEQPEAIIDTLRGRISPETGETFLEGLKIDEEECRALQRMTLVACGTSYYAGLVGKFWFEELAQLPVEVDLSSEFRYRPLVFTPKSLILAISQSGETADTLAAVQEGKRLGIRSLAICNVVGSTLSRHCDHVLYTHAGPEIGVASTKAFTTQMVTLFLLALHLGQRRGVLPLERCREIVKELFQIPKRIEEILQEKEKLKRLAQRYYHARDFLYIARGVNYPIALEGALKLKEISYIHAEGYPAGELKHGPIALVDENVPVVILVSKGKIFSKVVGNLEEVKARGGKIVAFEIGTDSGVQDKASDWIGLPSIDDLLSPFMFIVPLQLLAYYIAVLKGTDVDQPRNLAKSVTVE
ncbi:MAG: glutamine--fructose-6-phosphate transaminase (isomerizing) [Deltaproteobacteria bacterium]|nr:glutamine--fructose-6-phosphate transaminase (isomerizing) [Deltaproteobacteria bacterium]